jgi:hypothetical protein
VKVTAPYPERIAVECSGDAVRDLTGTAVSPTSTSESVEVVPLFFQSTPRVSPADVSPVMRRVFGRGLHRAVSSSKRVRESVSPRSRRSTTLTPSLSASASPRRAVKAHSQKNSTSKHRAPSIASGAGP